MLIIKFEQGIVSFANSAATSPDMISLLDFYYRS